MEIGSITCKVTPDMTGMHPLIEELTATRAALDAAQDEIERLISEKEALRAQVPTKDHIMDAIHTVLHPECTDPDSCLVDIYTAEEIADGIMARGGGS